MNVGVLLHLVTVGWRVGTVLARSVRTARLPRLLLSLLLQVSLST